MSDTKFSRCALLSAICGEHLRMSVKRTRTPAICGLLGMLLLRMAHPFHSCASGWSPILFVLCDLPLFLSTFSASDMVVHAEFILLAYHIDVRHRSTLQYVFEF